MRDDDELPEGLRIALGLRPRTWAGWVLWFRHRSPVRFWLLRRQLRAAVREAHHGRDDRGRRRRDPDQRGDAPPGPGDSPAPAAVDNPPAADADPFEMRIDRCRVCGAWLGVGIVAFHVGLCETCRDDPTH